ncbi:hypothetical protein AKJ18_09110 [Vibrio xuii]|nr:hypothetical protein AKJ18_09110 [Vibrio xuii]
MIIINRLASIFQIDTQQDLFRLLSIRFASAIALFALLGQANIWLSPSSNVLLAVGYRALLVLVPVLLFWFQRQTLTVCVFLSMTGIVVLWSAEHIYVEWLGILSFSIGISILGYLTKTQAAVTEEGAGLNKIMLNVGSLVAGAVLMLNFEHQSAFYVSMVILLLSILPVAWRLEVDRASSSDKRLQGILHIEQKPIWVLAGLITGIKLFAVFSILPQYLINTLGELPRWYGALIIANGLLLTVFQLPVTRLIKWLSVSNTFSYMTLLFVGMFTLAVPQWFEAHTLWGALVWVAVLSLSECALSFIDHAAKKADGLLLKELFVGFGAGYAVLCMRAIPEQFNAFIIAGSGVLMLCTWALLIHRRNTLEEAKCQK